MEAFFKPLNDLALRREAEVIKVSIHAFALVHSFPMATAFVWEYNGCWKPRKAGALFYKNTVCACPKR